MTELWPDFCNMHENYSKLSYLHQSLDVMCVQVMYLNHGECKMCFHHIYSQVTKVIGYPQN